MPLALSFVPTQSSAGAPSGWERSLSDVRVFRVRPPPPDVQSLGGRRFPCGSAGIEFEDAALRDKLQSPTRVGVQKYPNQVGAPRPSLGDRESGGGWEAHLGTPRSSPDIRPHLGAEGAAAAEGGPLAGELSTLPRGLPSPRFERLWSRDHFTDAGQGGKRQPRRAGSSRAPVLGSQGKRPTVERALGSRTWAWLRFAASVTAPLGPRALRSGCGLL